MKSKIFYLWVCLSCSCTGVCGQQLTLTVSDLFALADSADLTIESAREAVQAARESLIATKKEKLPDLSVSASVSYNADGYVWDRNFQNGMKVEIPSFGNNFSFQVSQVIYAGSALRTAQELAEQSMAMTEADLEKSRQDVYFTFCGYLLDIAEIDESISIYRKNIELANRILWNLKTRVDVGSALSNDITRYQLHIDKLELQLQRLSNTRRILNYNLTVALKLDAKTEIIPSIDFADRTPALDFTESYAMKKMNLAVSMSRSNEKIAKSDLMPKIALVGATNIDGPILIEIPALNNNFHYWYVGIGIRYNFDALYKAKNRLNSSRHKTQSAIALRDNVQEQLSKSIFATNIKYIEADTEIAVSENNLKLARENYQIVSNRYESGLALMTDMLDASNIVLSSEIELHNTKTAKLYSYYELQYISGKLSK